MLMYQEHAVLNGLHWVSITDPTHDDIQKLHKKFDLTPKFQSYVQDPRERSRYDYNEATDTSMLIWQVVIKDELDQGYHVIPVSFIVTSDTLISTVSERAQRVNDELQRLFTQKSKQQQSIITILLQLLWRLNDQYMDQIDDINAIRADLAKYRKNPTNKQIEALASLSNQLVHLTTATDNNVMAIKQMKLSGDADSDAVSLSKREREMVADVEIETNQSQQITQDTADLVERLSNTYNNILNNSLNDTMRFLTVWSLILAVPPIISGFYGMNMHLPLAIGQWAWVGTLFMTAALIVAVVWLVHRRK